jgi:hypothetical protein
MVLPLAFGVHKTKIGPFIPAAVLNTPGALPVTPTLNKLTTGTASSRRLPSQYEAIQPEVKRQRAAAASNMIEAVRDLFRGSFTAPRDLRVTPRWPAKSLSEFSPA